MVIPQQSYCFKGSLYSQVVYPTTEEGNPATEEGTAEGVFRKMDEDELERIMEVLQVRTCICGEGIWIR